MLHYDRIDLSEGNDLTKSNSSKESLFVTIGVLIMGLNYKVLLIIVVMI